MAASANFPISVAVPARRRLYRNPPIVETVLDIGIVAGLDATEENLAQILEVETSYARHALVDAAHTEIVAGAPTISMARALAGFDDANNRSVHLARDRFAFSKHAKYSQWEDVQSEALRLWERYTSILRPTHIRRIGLRYVNRLDLPAPVQNINEYLLTLPLIAPGISSIVSGYTLQLNLPQPDLTSTLAIVRQATVQPPRPGVVSIVLDIEIARSFSSNTVTPQSLWHEFEILHDRENDIFERTITDKLRFLFDQ